MNDIRIGVDLGTCYSSVGYDDHHSVRFMQDPAAPQLTYSIPSCALLREDNGRFVFGEQAAAERNATPEGYQPEFKRDLGSSAPYWMRGRQISAAELTAEFLRFLVDLTVMTLAAAPASAVITVPAYYDAYRRSLIDDAARHACLAGTSLVAEPVAAVVSAAERGEVTGDTTTLVYDLGGGTFDAAVVRLDGGKQQVLGAKGLPDFGGTDIDVLIEQDFARKAGDEFADMLAGQDADDPKRRAQALRARIEAREFCRKIKHQLSSAEHASDFLHLTIPYELSRRKLEDMVHPHLDRTVSTCRQLLASIALTPDQIDTVLLVGGASRMPMVREVLATALDRPVRLAADPELAVCMGAAILARTGPPRSTSAPSSGRSGPRAEGHITSPPRPDGPPARAVIQQAEELYVDALAAFWTEQFDQAIELLEQVLATWPDHPEASDKLEETRRQQQLTTRYAQACTAAEAEDWEQAVAGFTQVSDINPRYRDVAVRLENAREQQQIAVLRAEARRLYNARQWAAVVKVGDRLRALNPDAADLDDLMTSARTELAAAERAERMAEDYRAALRMLDAGAWQQATDALEQIAQVNPGYRDTSALLARARSLANEPKQPQREARGIMEQPKVVQAFRHQYAAVNVLASPNQCASVNSVAFSADRRWLASSASDGSVQIWDTTTGRQHLRVMAYAWAVIFSTDGRWLVTSGRRKTQIWDTTTGQQRLSVKHKSSRDHALALTPDGRWLATGSPGNAVRIWDTADGHELMKISHPQQMNSFNVPYGVDGLAFSPDGRWLATASTDKTARIWDTATGHPILEATHGGAVAAVAFSPDGRWLATASTDKTARIWDTATGQMLAELPHEKAVQNVVFNPDGDRLATASGLSAQIWALYEGSDCEGLQPTEG